MISGKPTQPCSHDGSSRKEVISIADKKFRGRDKIVQKMTKDGLVDENLRTGEQKSATAEEKPEKEDLAKETAESTSFDCSGFVCWVINNSGNGWSVGRTTANGLRGKCSYVSPADAQPGDLIFFEKTYNTVGASHVGIYVGNGMMIHCGDPISYTSINSTYWQSHFLGFGRIN